MIFSSLSPQETYRMHGKVSRAQLEELLDAQEKAADLDDVKVKVEEGMTQFPAEDFLEGIKNRMFELSKKLRGANKEELQGIIEQLDDIAQCTFNASDYGRSELRDAIKMIEEAM